MPYRSRPGQPKNLIAQIEDEMRDRLREAVDHVSLEVLVESRRARGQAHPAADSPADRGEFEAGGRAFLERLDREMTRTAPDDLKPALAGIRARPGSDPVTRLLDVQVALARAIPDYWQRFEAIRTEYTAEHARSGGQRGGLLRQIFGR